MSVGYSQSHIPSIPKSIPKGIRDGIEAFGMTTVAQRVSQAMEWRGLDQTDLASAIGVTQGAISKILVGKTANSRLLPRIAVELRVPLQWLLCKTDDPSIGAAELAITDEDRQWLDLMHSLTKRDRWVVSQLMQSMADVRVGYTASSGPETADTLHSSGMEFRHR